jgi:hypothetical protein
MEDGIFCILRRDLCINRNNHQKPTFHPLGDFLNPALALLGQGLKKSPIGQKLDFANHPYLCKGLKKANDKETGGTITSEKPLLGFHLVSDTKITLNKITSHLYTNIIITIGGKDNAALYNSIDTVKLTGNTTPPI